MATTSSSAWTRGSNDYFCVALEEQINGWHAKKCVPKEMKENEASIFYKWRSKIFTKMKSLVPQTSYIADTDDFVGASYTPHNSMEKKLQ